MDPAELKRKIRTEISSKDDGLEGYQRKFIFGCIGDQNEKTMSIDELEGVLEEEKNKITGGYDPCTWAFANSQGTNAILPEESEKLYDMELCPFLVSSNRREFLAARCSISKVNLPAGWGKILLEDKSSTNNVNSELDFLSLVGEDKLIALKKPNKFIEVDLAKNTVADLCKNGIIEK